MQRRITSAALVQLAANASATCKNFKRKLALQELGRAKSCWSTLLGAVPEESVFAVRDKRVVKKIKAIAGKRSSAAPGYVHPLANAQTMPPEPAIPQGKLQEPT